MRPAAGQRFHSDFPIEHAHVELVIEELTAEAEEVEDTRSAFERRDERASRLYQSPRSPSEATVLGDGVFNEPLACLDPHLGVRRGHRRPSRRFLTRPAALAAEELDHPAN